MFRELGNEFGTGPLVGVIIRTTGADESAYPPIPGTETEYACTVILTNYSIQDRDGTQITARDIMVLIAPDAETTPQNGDKLRVNGETFHIVNVDTVQPGGVALMWECQAKKGD